MPSSLSSLTADNGTGTGNFKALQLAMDNFDFGPIRKKAWMDNNHQAFTLSWLSPLNCDIDIYLLTVNNNDADSIETRTFQKAINMNLYLYRCPSSAQPESVLKSLIYETLHWYFWQNTHITNFGRFAELFFERLAARAHKKCDLAPLFYFNSIFKLARHAWTLFYTSRIFGFNFSIMSCAFSSPEALCWNTNFLHKTGIFSMRESRWPARYCTVLSSKNQIIFWRRHKIECDNGMLVMWYNKEETFSTKINKW